MLFIFSESCLAFSEVEARGASDGVTLAKSFVTVMALAFPTFCRDDYDSTARPRASSLCIHGAPDPIRFLASLFMLGLINAAFD